jgi:hypothetical protein
MCGKAYKHWRKAHSEEWLFHTMLCHLRLAADEIVEREGCENDGQNGGQNDHDEHDP